ncbi:hypothetical protein QBC39DRAFT_387805 [Podospora conica]|nr:hypothetical protein QBC39DRAFT_387805 [Schizothecium conicum]
MGQPPQQQQQHGIPLAGSSRLAQQHERLILELLPFKSADQFQEWLGSVYVRGAWHEFGRDFLNLNVFAREPDKDKMAQKTKDAVNARNPKYLIFHPDKDGWTSDDHHIRFMATVISDNMLKGLWSESEWKKKGLDIAKAIYEVLSFLRGTKAPAADPDPPQYEG